MTIAARKVLADLKLAHTMLEDEEDRDRFRILWVACVALCRTVGDALDKVDRHSSHGMSRAISSAYERWKTDPISHQIFFEFIKHERDAILHEHQHGYQSGGVFVATATSGSAHLLEDDLYSPMTAGPFASEDCRDALAAAIKWWREQLLAIDSTAT